MKHVSPVGIRGVVNFVGSVACCALMLAGCGAFGAAGAPVVVRVDSPALPTPTEAVVLAHRILQRESDDLPLDTGQRRELAREIDRVLSRIRDAYPAMAALTVRQQYGFGELILKLEPDLFRAVHVLLPETGQVALHTGHEDFDALNARLGLSAVELFPFVGNECVFYFDEPLNVGEAIRVYSMLEGIEYAEANNFLGDGTDIDAVKSQGTWHVAVRPCVGRLPVRLHFS